MSEDDRYKEHTLLLHKISDQVSEQSKVIAKLDKKVDLNIQQVQYELEKIHRLDEQQNELIDKHIEGVNTLKDMQVAHVAEAEIRFAKLEEPRKWIQTTKKLILTAGALAATAFTILKLLSII